MAKWPDSEIIASIQTYLWMLRAQKEEYNPVTKRIRNALMQGPLKERSHASIEYRFQNISAVLDTRGEEWVQGYPPGNNGGPLIIKRISSFIDACREDSYSSSLPWVVDALEETVVRDAARNLATGKEYEFYAPSSYDLDVGGLRIPACKVISLSSSLQFGAPLFPENFTQGEDESCFRKLAACGLISDGRKDFAVTNPEASEFRRLVIRYRELVSDLPPRGNPNPERFSHASEYFRRDATVVAFVENRANGKCELCGGEAPFTRPDGTPYLEMHHIVPLRSGGSDTVDNTVALCPNCHRSCHYGSEASIHNHVLKTNLGDS